MSVNISVVIPAYNEATRLPAFLEKLADHCLKSRYSYEIVVVDDGSRDATADVVINYQKRFERLVLLKNRSNRGKGYAVKRGLLRSSGDVALFMDADGSVTPDEIERNLPYVTQDEFHIFIGSRVLTGPGQVLSVKWHRKLIGRLFNFLVQKLLFKNIKDTQCGFKMFRREVVKPLVSRIYLKGFGFDIEMLYLAHKMGYRVKEGPVSWHNVRGSKVNLVKDSLIMFLNIMQVRNWHCTPINPYGKYLGVDEYQYMYDMEERHWWFISHRNLVMRIIRFLHISDPIILDVGAGTGGKMMMLNRIGKSYGIDVSPKAIEFCRKRGLQNVFLCPAEKLIFPDNMFDIVTCLDVLEHVSNPMDVLVELKRVLKDSGRLILTVPAFRILWSQHDEALCHMRRYEKDSLLAELNEAGLRIHRLGYLFFTSFFFVAPVRFLKRFFGVRIKSDTTTLPPGFLNRWLVRLFSYEIQVSLTRGLPFGTTLYAVVSKIVK